jgi:outer membrane protein
MGKTRMSRTTVLTGAVALAIAMVFSAASSRAETLAEAFAAAYETNPDLIAARAALRARDETVNQARAGMRPNVSAVLDYGLAATDDSLLGSDNNDPFAAELQASQSLYDGGVTANSVRGRIADVSAERARLTSLEQRVMLAVATAYLDVRRDEEFVRLAENNVRVIAEQLRATQDRFEVGEVTRTDVSQAEARLAEADANLSSQVGQLQQSRQRYRQIVGTEPQSLVLPPSPPATPSLLEDAVQTAMENHPDVIAARFDEVSASRDIRAAIGGLLPNVSLNASVGYNEDGLLGSDRDQTQATVGVRAVVPFYQGGAEYSRVRQAQASASAARAQITSEARRLRQEVEAAWTQLQVARSTIVAGRQRVQASQLAFDGVREEALVGSRTTLDVLDAEQELLNARTSLVSSVRDEYVAAYNLLAAVGVLTAAQQGLTVAAYDPEVNYVENNDRAFGFPRTEDTQWEEFWRP